LKKKLLPSHTREGKNYFNDPDEQRLERVRRLTISEVDSLMSSHKKKLIVSGRSNTQEG